MKEKIRVAQVFYTFDIEVGGGGLTAFAIELGKKLDPDRFQVSLISLGYCDTPSGLKNIEWLNSAGIRAFNATAWNKEHPYRSFNRSVQALAADIKLHPLDIFHSHSEYTDIVALILKLNLQPMKIMRTVHYGYRHEWIKKSLRRLLLTNFLYPLLFNKEIGINHTVTNRLNNRLLTSLRGKQAQFIPNAIPLEKFTSTVVDKSNKRHSLGIPMDAVLIGSVGRLSDQKGYCYLIEAIPNILKEIPDAYFLVVGDGPLKEDLIEQSNRLGVLNRTIFCGGRSDVNELLRCMDLFVSSSLWEGLPTVILESMASNTPIIATNISGTNQLIEHNVNGWLVPPANSSEMSAAIIALLKAPTVRATIAQAAKSEVHRYSIDHIARQYEAVYQNLVHPQEPF